MTFKVTKEHFYVIERLRDFFTFRFSDLITTLTYILMDNFCLFFLVHRPQEINSLISMEKNYLVYYVIFELKTRFARQLEECYVD